MVNSVVTNIGAIVALQSLNKTNASLDIIQKQISTGYRVADAVDDGAAFAVAQGLRSTSKGLDAVDQRLSAAQGLINVTSAGLSNISDTLAAARATLTKLADASLSTNERAQYNADYAAQKTEVTNFVNQASFNGTNILSSGTAVTIVFDSSGGQFTFAGQNTAGSITAGLATVANATAAAAALTSGGALSVFETAVGSSLATVGGYSRSVTNQQNFLKIINDATNTGIGAIVDADLAKASASLQSLQIRQQLGTQSLSIANQAPSILLSLFK